MGDLSRCALVGNGFDSILLEYVMKKRLMIRSLDLRIKDGEHTVIDMVTMHLLVHFLKYKGNGCLGRLVFSVSSRTFDTTHCLMQLLTEKTTASELEADRRNDAILRSPILSQRDMQSDNDDDIISNGSIDMEQFGRGSISDGIGMRGILPGVHDGMMFHPNHHMLYGRSSRSRGSQRMEDIWDDNDIYSPEAIASKSETGKLNTGIEDLENDLEDVYDKLRKGSYYVPDKHTSYAVTTDRDHREIHLIHSNYCRV